jgi:sulfate transport system permease protein
LTRSISLASGALRKPRQRRILPAFGLSLGFTVVYLSLIVLIPLAGLVWQASGLGLDEFISVTTSPRAIAAFKLTFGASFISALINAVLGVVVAWVLVRYRFPGRRVLDALVDFPLALPTAVAGLTYSSLYVPKGWLGHYTNMAGIKVSYDQVGVVLILTFIAMPFVVRTVQPVLQTLDRQVEEAAASLGATRVQTLFRVILPALVPTVLTGTALAFARAVGEYGSVIFIAGNLPLKTEIAPLLVVIQLESFDYAAASAIALVLLIGSVSIVGAINLTSRRLAHG